MDKKLLVWFDEEKEYYRLFLINGEELPTIMAVTVNDNFGRGKVDVVFKAKAQVVNTKPVPNAES